jgi:bifunctional DNA-binding transcriptional regulator/antitoxin component of YhaV-PrlF toxin-antitoxin module
MAKVTSKYQVTVPRAVADEYAIKPGDEIDWIPAGEAIRVVKRLPAKRRPAATAEGRLRRFDEASARQRQRDKTTAVAEAGADRGWSREDLYRRGRSG